MQARKYFPKSTNQLPYDLVIQFDKQYYAGGEEVKVEIKFKATKALQNVTKIEWEAAGAEYVHWEVLNNNIHSVNTKGEKIFANKVTIFGAAKNDQKDFEEGEEHNWEVKYVLPEDIPPTYKSPTARVDYYFAVIFTQKFQDTKITTQKIAYYTVLKPFNKEDLFEARNEFRIEGEGKCPSPSIKRRILGEESTQSMVEAVVEGVKNVHCGVGDEEPKLPLVLKLTSKATTHVTDFRIAFARKTTVQIDKHSNVDRRVVYSKTFPLEPPLEPLASMKYHIDVVLPSGLNPSVDSKLINSTYILTIQIKHLYLKSFINVSNAPKGYEPIIVAVDENKANKFETSLLTQLKTTSPSPSKWSVKEVASYLAIRGLAEYKRLLEKNKIDGEALLALEESHYAELGITKLGDVVKLKKLIEELRVQEERMGTGERAEDVSPIEMTMFEMKNKMLITQSLRMIALSSQ